MYTDVQKSALFYTVVAFDDSFTCSVVDYGTYPPQRERFFTLAKLKDTLQKMYPNGTLESQLYSGLTDLMTEMLEKRYEREDGALIGIDKAMIDANWGVSTEIIYQFIRQFKMGGLIYPSHGKYIGAGSKPITDYTKKSGDNIGLNWYIPANRGKGAVRHVVYDTNFWKSFLHSRLAVPTGAKSSMTLYGNKPSTHELLSLHLTAETRVRTAGMGRIVDEWKMKPDNFDNHWFDCLVGCCVLASINGATLPEFSFREGANFHEKNVLKLSNMQRLSVVEKSVNSVEKQRLKLSDLLKTKRMR